MHTLISFILSLFIGLPPGKIPVETDINQTVVVSLRSGDAGRLSTRFAHTLELVIDSEKVEFTAVQADHAALILRSFFRKYPPQRFQFMYQGVSDHLRYSTGIYESGSRQFAVYVLMRQTDSQHYVINALHFRKE